MMRWMLALGLLGCLVMPLRADDDPKKITLGIGDDAPKLGLKEFVKGEKVDAFEKDTIYVLEFWATWCGPCVRAIPHVTELQKKYPKTVFIGVNVWEQNLAAVRPFVDDMGDKMNYRVAIDQDGESGRGFMAKNWLEPAGQNGIPCSFIINGQGKIAWIGHPMQMDKPLDDIVNGRWDLQAAKDNLKKEKERQARLQAMSGKLRQAMAAGPEEGIRIIDEIIATDAELEKMLGLTKFNLLVKLNKPERTLEYAKHLVDNIVKDEAMMLNNIAWTLIDPERKEPIDNATKKFALSTAEKADRMHKGADAATADTLARAYFINGDVDKAISTQERALAKARGTEMEKDLAERLDEYKRAKK